MRTYISCSRAASSSSVEAAVGKMMWRVLLRLSWSCKETKGGLTSNRANPACKGAPCCRLGVLVMLAVFTCDRACASGVLVRAAAQGSCFPMLLACVDESSHANLAHAAAPNALCLQPWADVRAARVETYQLLLTLLFSGRPKARCVPRPSGMLYPRVKV